MVTGCNEAFIIDGRRRAELIAEDARSTDIIKPLAIGDDVRRWRINLRDRWLIFARRGIDIDRYPAVKRHLSAYRPNLEPKPRGWKQRKPGDEWQGRKPGSYKWFEIQDDIAYFAEFSKPKIVFPEICKEARFAFDDEGRYVNNKAFIIPLDDLYLLGVMNSSPFWAAAKLRCAVLGDEEQSGRLMLQWANFQRAPVPRASKSDRGSIAALVSTILTQAAPDGGTHEREIDARVDFLYFHQHEAPTYDEWVAKRERERGTLVEEVRKLIEAGESRTVEFKRSLEYVNPADFANVPEPQRAQKIAEAQKAVVHSALKTICAFLNSKGGNLLIGVHDTDGPVGIEPDYALLGRKKDWDGFQNKLTDLIKARINPIPTDLDIDPVEIDGKTICRIQVPASRAAHYLDNKLYTRLGNSTEELSGRDLQDFLDRRGGGRPDASTH